MTTIKIGKTISLQSLTSLTGENSQKSRKPLINFNKVLKPNPSKREIRLHEKRELKTSLKATLKKKHDLRGQIKGNILLLRTLLGNIVNKISSDAKLKETNKLYERLMEPELVNTCVDQVIAVHNKLIESLGIKFGTKRWKDIANYCIKKLEEFPLDTSPNNLQLAVGDTDRWPKILGKLRPFYHLARLRSDLSNSSHLADQFIRTLLGIPRMVEEFSELNIDSITAPGADLREFRPKWKEFLKLRLSDRNWRKLKSQNFDFTPSLNNSNKAGPCGGPKWNNIDLEARLLIESPLWASFCALCSAMKVPSLQNFVEKIACDKSQVANLVKSRGIKSPLLRKIMAVPDSGNKSRAIAVGDIFTQILMHALERQLVSILTKEFSDVCAFKDHNNGFQKLMLSVRPGIQSLDASNWTDRLPAILQKDLLTSLYGSEMSDAWYNLVVRCHWTISGSNETIRYEAGQGMGIHSSFVIATITDLLLVEYAYSQLYPELAEARQKSTRSNFYNKVGDDLWIYDPDLKFVEFYKSLGVDINLSKSKSCSSDNIVAEYVSRNINRGLDVSRISARLCREAEKNIFMLPTLLNHLQQRLKFSEEDFINLIKSIYLNPKIYKKKFLFGILAKIGLLEKSIFAEQTFLASTGRLIFKALEELEPETFKILKALERRVEQDKGEFSRVLLLNCINKEWNQIEPYLHILKVDLDYDKNTYYNLSICLLEEDFFNEKLIGVNPLAYINFLKYGKAVNIKNLKLNPFLFKGVDYESTGGPLNQLEELRTVLYSLSEFLECFLNLEVIDANGSKASSFKLHSLYQVSKFITYNIESDSIEFDKLSGKFKNEITLLDSLTEGDKSEDGE